MPSAPINFSNVASITLASRIGLSWSAGGSGGKPIIDYQIYFDQSTDTWIELVSGITSLSYTTVTTLTQGRTYKFKISARTSVGYGPFSSVISILAA